MIVPVTARVKALYMTHSQDQKVKGQGH